MARFLHLIAFLAIFAISACSKAPNRLSTGRVIEGREVLSAVPFAVLGDNSYAEVRADSLPVFYSLFRTEVFRHGVVRWSERFDCNHFAAYYVALAQVRFYLDSFHSSTPAQTLALAPYWLKTGPNTAHALVVALTDRGIVFIEPQTGKEVPSSDVAKGQPMLAMF